MNVVQHKTAGQFLKRSGEWLQRAEAENNLVLGISRYFVTNEGRVNVKPYLLTVEDRGILLGAALMMPPRRLIITRMPDPALAALADYFFKEGITVPGIVGPKSTPHLFADHWQSQTGKRICVSTVYTPPHLRKQGYATSCVATLTQRMLDSGKNFCCLYTDLANPTSNAIYHKIGYQPICDVQDLGF